MLTTLDRYVLREVIQTWVVVTFVLLLIMLSSRFARYLGEAAAGNLPSDVVFTLLGLTSVQYLTVLVPVSLFLAVMLAQGRLYRDSEMTAMMACGIGYARFLRPLLLLAAVAAIGLAILSMIISPWAAQATHEVRENAQREAEAAGFEAGRFRTGGGGDTVFYAEQVGDGGRELQRVFIHTREGDVVTVSQAARAEQRLDRETGARHLVLHDGHRYTIHPGRPDYQVIIFEEYGLRIDAPERESGAARRAVRPTHFLWQSNELGDTAELQWRISVPLMGLVLVVLAVPLGRSSPRQGRYAKLLAAILVYVLYSNLLGISQVWIEREQIPAWIGLWWVHAGMLAFATVLVAKHYGWRYMVR